MPFWNFAHGFGKPSKKDRLPKLASMRLHFVFLPENPIVPLDEAEMIAAVDRQVSDLTAMTSVTPLTYHENGREIIPIFTSEERMQDFAQSRPPIWEYESDKAFSFNGIGQDGGDTLSYLRDCFDTGIVVLLDARTKHEIDLTRADVEAALEPR